MRVVSDRLGHSSTGITADLYTHVSPAVAGSAADAIGDAVSRRLGTLQSPAGEPLPSVFLARDRPEAGEEKPAGAEAAGQRSGPPGDQTLNPRIESPVFDVSDEDEG